MSGGDPLQAGGHPFKSDTAQSKNLVFQTENGVFAQIYKSILVHYWLPAAIRRLGQPCLVFPVSALLVTKEVVLLTVIGEPTEAFLGNNYQSIVFMVEK